MEEQTTSFRRKGQPKKPDQEALWIKVLRCANLWILTAAVIVVLIMFWYWALHNIRLVTAAAQALTQMSAEAVDGDAAQRIAKQLLTIREDAPQKPTAEYTADEQVVLLARYRGVEETEEWQVLHRRLSEISSRYAYADEFSLVCVDETAQQMIWLVSPGHPTGYSAVLTDLAFPGENGYELSAIAGHREGTAVLCGIPGADRNTSENSNISLYICGGFSFAGIMGSEVKKLLLPAGLVLLVMAIASLRLYWIVRWKLKQTEQAAKDKEEQEAKRESNKEEL